MRKDEPDGPANRSQPIRSETGLVEGWYFSQREESAGCYAVEGSEAYGYTVSRHTARSEKGQTIVSSDEALRNATKLWTPFLGLERSGKTLRFFHGGRNAGFDALLLAYAEFGTGVVIMFNANDDSGAAKRIVDAVSKEYHWPGAERAGRRSNR